MDPKEEQRESIAADVAEIGGEIALDGMIEGAFELAIGLGESAVGIAGEVVGGALEGI